MNHQRFDELLESYESALKTIGLGYSSRLTAMCHAGMIIQWHENKGQTWFDNDIIAEYLQDLERKFYEGELGKKQYNKKRLDVERLLSFSETGVVVKAVNSLKGSRCPVTPEFESVVDAFLESDNFHSNTRNDMRWVAHKYFSWLTNHGHENIYDAGAEQIQKFLLDCSKKHTSTSVYNIKLYLKKLYAYLYTEKLSQSAYEELLSFPINRESKIFPALPMKEVVKLLGTIDRKLKSGKRAYAAMILGAELGLRACDVANLKLGDIDWVRGEIKILQLKTNKAVVLPLTQKVGEALRDYILNGRPKTDERHVFLRLVRPYTPLKSSVSIGEIYRDCCKAAGLPVSKSFHTLRRSLATAMVTSGTSIVDVAQVLGDELVDSTKKYISLDSTHLKQCALSFNGIASDSMGGDECVH
jgi:site-specific recombinase XerD